MLRKMRWRFILAAMLAFFAVIALIGVLVNIVNYYTVTRRIDRSVSRIVSFEEHVPDAPPPDSPGTDPPPPFRDRPDEESNYMMRFFVVRFDRDGEPADVSLDYVASVGESEALQYAETALNRRKSRGYIGEYRYARESLSDHTVVVFMNAEQDLRNLRSLLYLTLTISGGSLILVFVLVMLLAEKAMRPIADNIARQKQFITDASHELKTPLTSISASIDVLAVENGEDEWTENIRSQTGRMSKLVSDLVMLSRLDETLPLPSREQFSLSDAAWEIADVFRPQAKAGGKRFTANIEDGLSFFGDRAALQQLMSVLLDNAVRYSDPEGEIRFEVTKKRNRTRIEVFNTCQYETVPDVNRLFDRFYRPDSARNSETGGTGVGLAVAKAVTEAHGGSITAVCPDGKSMTIRALF